MPMAVQFNDLREHNNSVLPERFERKYYLTPGTNGVALGILRHVCVPAEEFYHEQINSLYFDTFDLDQHERSVSGDHDKDKIRIRWYGEKLHPGEQVTAFLELKSRRGFASTKQRCNFKVMAESLTNGNLGQGIITRTVLMDSLARFGYFPTRMLHPVIRISYWRYRFSEVMTHQRVSLDYRIRSTMILPGAGNGEKELELPGGLIEIKGRTMEIPATLMRASILDTNWTRFSKYSSCIESHHEKFGTVGRLSPSGRIIDF
jgi:hypothetical protein